MTMPSHRLGKRLVPYGPIIRLPNNEQLCPNKGGTQAPKACIDIPATDGLYESAEDLPLKRRDLAVRYGEDTEDLQQFHQWDRRLSKNPLPVWTDNGKMTVFSPNYPEATVIYNED